MPVINTWRGKKAPENIRAFVGWGGLLVNDDKVDVLDLLRAYAATAAGESCGQCFPCRSGLKRIAARLADLCEGRSRPDDAAYLRGLAELVCSSARCDIGQTSPRALLDVLDTAPHLLEAKKTTPGTYTGIVTAPCINACPSHVNVPAYIENIRFRRFDKGLENVMRDCPMPGTIGRVCERPCEAACKRGLNEAPVAIRHLKRFLYDEDARAQQFPERATLPANAKKVAVVGAGPAGLACAYYLSLAGLSATIFERQPEPGGMAKYGIPDYRLPPHVLAREAEKVRRAGCDIQYGVDIGHDVTLADLEQQGYEAVFIGAGAPDAPGMRCEGEHECSVGYLSGIYYLSEATKGRRPLSGKRLVVVGGGNVAMDCVRTALRQGFNDVQVLYRRTEDEMPADKLEIKEAKEEGAAFNFLAAPVRILNKDGKVCGIVCQRMRLGDPDASGRRSPVPIEGDTFELPCDAVIHAIGQKVSLELILKGRDGGLNKWNTLDADATTGTVAGLSGIFGGGDCVTGPKTLIAALAAGKRAAAYIAAHLSGKGAEPTAKDRLERMVAQMDMIAEAEQLPLKNGIPPMPIHTLPPKVRVQSFEEVEKDPHVCEAAREASRCLRCFRIAMVAQ